MQIIEDQLTQEFKSATSQEESDDGNSFTQE
jgi:hypothetical protein